MRKHSVRRVFLALLLLSSAFLGAGQVSAQSNRAQLVGRAVMPANTQVDGQPAGAALVAGALINGVKFPFDSQPVGTISAVLPGEYPNTWLLLFDAQLGVPEQSSDYLLRFYTAEIAFRRAQSGSGDVLLLNWQHLGDPDRRIARPVVNAETPLRYLSGADFAPLAFQRVAGGTFWVAESRTPALLRFDAFGKLLEPPVPLNGGALQGMSIYPDGSALIIAQRSMTNSRQVIFRTYDLTTRTFADLPATYTLESADHVFGGFAMINAQEAFAIEADRNENRAAAFKRVFLISLANGSKVQVADLLDIADPNGISTSNVFAPPPNAYGLGDPFRFPFAAITALYPIDEQTLLIANNNRLPYGLGRSDAEADATEFIAIRLAQPFALDPAFQRPIR
ncbi:MAG: esterase-like activity of phytase family protein [Anaerolineae bacterium]|nr:esterase-like activity of phytase family protein [Anaerolineae bacterium]MDW8300438.1 esterase-like activity of phytase family protein [Anaerolineae bacterium]